MTKLRSKPTNKHQFDVENAGKDSQISRMKKRLGLTVPQSPHITKPKPKRLPEPSPPRIFKANPVRRLPVFKVELLHEHTKPAEFKLPGDEISHQKKEKFKAQIDELFDELEAYRHFHAQPLPDLSPEVS
jgi:hypothetical protein